jgi:hypothetical protein
MNLLSTNSWEAQSMDYNEDALASTVSLTVTTQSFRVQTFIFVATEKKINSPFNPLCFGDN